jgi:hypothetical protein
MLMLGIAGMPVLEWRLRKAEQECDSRAYCSLQPHEFS